ADQGAASIKKEKGKVAKNCTKCCLATSNRCELIYCLNKLVIHASTRTSQAGHRKSRAAPGSRTGQDPFPWRQGNRYRARWRTLPAAHHSKEQADPAEMTTRTRI